MEQSSSPGFKGIAFSAFGCSCWGLSGIFAKLLFEEKEIPATCLTTIRLICAGLILLVISTVLDREKAFAVWKERKDALDIMVCALFGMMPSQACYFLSVSFSNPAVATILQYISPVLIMLACFIRDKKKPRPHEILILLFVMTGVFLISTHGSLHALSITPAALVWGLAAALAVTIYTVQPAGLIDKFGTLPVVGWAMFLGGISLVPFTRPWRAGGIWDRETLLLILLVVIVGTVFAYTGYLQGVKMIGPVRGSLIAGLEPLVSALFTSLVLHVSFTIQDIVGMALVILSVTLTAVL